MNTELLNIPDFLKIGVMALIFIVLMNFLARSFGLFPSSGYSLTYYLGGA